MLARAVRKGVRVVAERKAWGAPVAVRRVRVPVGLVLGLLVLVLVLAWDCVCGVGMSFGGGSEEDDVVLVLVLRFAGVEAEAENEEDLPTVTTLTPVRDSVRAGMKRVVASWVVMEVRRGWFWEQAEVSSWVRVE